MIVAESLSAVHSAAPSAGPEACGPAVALAEAEPDAEALGVALAVGLAEGDGDSSTLLLPPQPVRTRPAASSPATRRDGEAETLVLMGSP